MAVSEIAFVLVNFTTATNKNDGVIFFWCSLEFVFYVLKA